jgi:glutamine synthetase
MRSKTKVINDFSGKLEDCPIWSFDGSSTLQASGGSSDCLLKPVAIYPDPTRINGYLVMTEVLNADGTNHSSNARATIDDDDNDFWFGFEQEYFIMDTQTQLPLGFPLGGYPGPQDCTTALLAVEIPTEENLLKNTLTYVLKLDLTLKELTKKWLVVNGNSNCLLKVLKKLVMKFGLLDTF